MSLSFLGLCVLVLLGILVILVGVGVVTGISLASRRQREWDTNPNLAPCADCQRLISIQAPTCPHCGRPVKG